MNTKLIKKSSRVILLLISFFYLILPASALYAKEKATIKVGYPIVKNFTDKKNGLYTGYIYDYLREIAIYTGWEYEFVEMDLSDAMDALVNGEIDLLAGMYKNEQTSELFEFPTYALGSTYTTLSVLEDSPYLDENHYVVLDNMKVGYYGSSQTRLTNFTYFCETNEIENAELVPYPDLLDRELLVQKLRNHEVDALIGNDLSITSQEKVIAKFGATPHFLAATKGNTELTKALDRAIDRIQKRNPDFEDMLYSKYFEQNYYQALILSKAQSEYLKNLPSIKAVYIRNYIPVQYYDEKEGKPKGIFIDIVHLLARRLGIRLEFIPVDSYAEAYEMIESEAVDFVIGAVDDYLIADEHAFILTSHFLTMQLTKVINTESVLEDGPEIIALPKGHGSFNIEGNYVLQYYDTLKECLDAVNKGTAHATYANAYSLSYYLTHEVYNHIVTLPNTQELRIALGLSNSLDPEFVEIFHKAIYYLPDSQVAEIVMKNTFDTAHPFNFKMFFYQNMALCLSTLGTILALVAISIGIYIRLLFNKTQVDALTGIYNRKACECLVAKYLKRKKPSTYSAFIIIDIDHFKQINDRFGHKKGDALLVDFAHTLRKTFPKQAILSRLGGDEFIVVMKNMDECTMHKVAETLEQLCHTIHQEIHYNGQSQEISLSIGAILTNQALPFTSLYTAADEVLYEVKRRGRNGFKVKLM